ncbi:MAG: ATP-binding cassette domain-containing protein, partial [Treponema sp.]|nr:ATP-binding cassette domain-containing protein [Treponema sp.]
MIEVSHLSRQFGNFRAVDDVSFSIPTGQIVGLLGPNGAGKTTTMRMICGFLGATSGSVKIDGKDILEDPVEAKGKIGYMPESAPLYSDMIVEDYLNYVAQMQGVDAAQKVPALCQTCGLKEVMHKNISELSRGYRQRVGLAHALMNDPEILVLDEPTSGLDPNQIEDVRALIKEIGKTGTVIISTHILGEVETL